MIMRVFQVTVHDDKIDEFRSFFLDTAIPLTRGQPGCLAVTAGVPRPETPNLFCMVMVWENLDAMKAFVGEDWQDPHIHPDEAELVRARTITHYEMAA